MRLGLINEMGGLIFALLLFLVGAEMHGKGLVATYGS